MAGSGTLAYGVLWPIEDPGSWLPTWAAAALVGTQGIIAGGGIVTLMLPRTALIHIWGHKEGVSLSCFAPISLVCYSLWPKVLTPGGLTQWYPAGRGCAET